MFQMTFEFNCPKCDGAIPLALDSDRADCPSCGVLLLFQNMGDLDADMDAVQTKSEQAFDMKSGRMRETITVSFSRNQLMQAQEPAHAPSSGSIKAQSVLNPEVAQAKRIGKLKVAAPVHSELLGTSSASISVKAGGPMGGPPSAADQASEPTVFTAPQHPAQAPAVNTELETMRRQMEEERAAFEAERRAFEESRAMEAERARFEAERRAFEESRAKAELEDRLRAEAEAKIKAEMEAKMRAEAEAKIKAELEAKATAEIEAKAGAATQSVPAVKLDAPKADDAPKAVKPGSKTLGLGASKTGTAKTGAKTTTPFKTAGTATAGPAGTVSSGPNGSKSTSKSTTPRKPGLTPEQLKAMDEKVAAQSRLWKKRILIFNLVVMVPIALFIVWWKFVRVDTSTPSAPTPPAAAPKMIMKGSAPAAPGPAVDPAAPASAPDAKPKVEEEKYDTGETPKAPVAPAPETPVAPAPETPAAP